MAEKSGLKVLIVGAGIGGLTAALALRQQGHEVEVFEKSRLASEVGAAIHAAPNCTALWNRLGLKPEEFGGVFCKTMLFLNAKTEVMFRKDYIEEAKLWQAGYFYLHRVDLHNELKHKATSPTGAGIPVKLHTASAVTTVDCAAATITLADGRTLSGDLVIGADGIHSRTREAVTGKKYALESSGKACFRFLIPFNQLHDDPETRIFVENPGAGVQVTGPDSRHIVFYPCSDNTLVNVVAVVKKEMVGNIEQGWSQDANKENMVKLFSEGFSPAVHKMLEKAPDDDIKIFDLLDMEVLPTWIRGRTALLGDAAHPFLPFMGQGAAQAVEDACTLAALLPLGTVAEDVPKRLEVYEKARKERADWVQDFTRKRGRDPSGKDGPVPTPAEFEMAIKQCLAHNAWNHAVSVGRDHGIEISS
ncbi:FAD binding domain-containing protein [Macrophomina phaseolina]|uniref:FAD binding domain-containing protein n=1 Tax=Macrophomina phaseolina TaxID=35725 RepID=A0ABQ8G4G9_9PEZI|nr:FAD binding domain-containing protein [Macrophomina phaseolina]